MKTIDRCLLVQILHYNAITGIFHWRIRPTNRVYVGDIAGKINTEGYVQIQYRGELYSAHRLAWLYCYGYVPDIQIDHIDGDHSNNRLLNLRLCYGSTGVGAILNQQNRKGPQQNNTTGWLGVDYLPKRGKNCFRTRIMVDEDSVYIGRYQTVEEAGLMYLMAKSFYHPFDTMNL